MYCSFHTCLSIRKKDFQQDVGHSSGHGSERKWYSTNRPGGNGIESLNWWWSDLGESGHPVFRATSPLSRGMLKSKCGGKLSIHFCADGETIETVFRTIISVKQLSIYGAVLRCVWGIQYLSNKNWKTHIGRTIWPIVRASRLIDNDTWTFDRRSCTRRSIAKVPRTSGRASATRSIDKDLNWCRIPENSWSRQYFMTKHTDEFVTICSVSDMSWVHFTTRRQINWPERLDSRKHQKLNPYWESQPVTYEVFTEWKLELNL